MNTRCTTTWRLAGTAAVCLLVAAPASARQDPSELQADRGPGWTFTPAVAFGALYDTNVALAAPRASLGETQGDTLFNIVPSGQLEFLGKYTEFSAAYRGFLRRYKDVQGLDGFDQRASAGFKHAVSRRLSLFARNNYADSPTTDEVEVNGVPFRRTGSRTNTLAAGADYRFTKFTTLATRYDMTWVDFERTDDFGALAGGWIHGIRADLGRQLNARVTMGGEYGYRTASVNDGEREFGFQDAGGVIRVALGRHTTGSAAAGVAVLHDRSANDTRSGPYVRLGVAHALERVRLGAAFERQYVPSFGFGGASNSQELRGYVLMPVARQRVYVQGSGAWRRSVPFEAAALELDTIWLRSTVGLAATRWARVEGLYTYTRQDSIITGGEVDRHRVGVQFVISQPMRIQ